MNFPIMISRGRVLLWGAAFVLLLTAASHAADFTDHVVSVLDGDSVEVLHNQHPTVFDLAAYRLPGEWPSLRRASETGCLSPRDTAAGLPFTCNRFGQLDLTTVYF